MIEGKMHRARLGGPQIGKVHSLWLAQCAIILFRKMSPWWAIFGVRFPKASGANGESESSGFCANLFLPVDS